MQGEMNFVIEGQHILSGHVETARSKNGAVVLLAASLLNRGSTTLEHVPQIEEVNRLIEVLESIGVEVERDGTTVHITPPQTFDLGSINREAATKTRSILMFIGSLIHTLSSFDIPQSGGCTLGLRSVRQHLWVLEKFGVTIETFTDHYHVSHAGLSNARTILYEASDTATENALLAAAGIEGTSVIKYASANYQVQELCGFLEQLGVSIEGIGTTTLTVHGRKHINEDITYTVAEDPTDAMFFIAAAAVTGSAITIKAAPIEFLEVELFVLGKMGLPYALSGERTSENGITKLVDISIERPAEELISFPEKIHARPYPGLNIDNLPFFAAIATMAKGTTLIHDWSYEKRAIYYTELDRLGARTTLHDPHRISIEGPTHLKAAEVICPPALRPATIILVAMLAAKGRSTLRNVYSINRGYENIVRRLQDLGAAIELHTN